MPVLRRSGVKAGTRGSVVTHGLRSGDGLTDRVITGENGITMMCLLLAAMVLWSHVFAFARGRALGDAVTVVTRGLYDAGNIGVASVLMMTRALVLRKWERSRPLTFVTIRAAPSSSRYRVFSA